MFTSVNGVGRGSTRAVRKVEVPRPLKTSSSESKIKVSPVSLSLSAYSIDTVEKLITLMDMVVKAIIQTQNDDPKNVTEDTSALLTSNIAHLCKHLKTFGPQLKESIYEGQLDHAILVFREAMVHGFLDYVARAHLLEIIELRENGWVSPIVPHSKGPQMPNLELGNFIESNDPKTTMKHLTTTGESAIPLRPDEVLRRVVKHREKISKSQHYKDEVVIRNSDSGKGIKFEYLSIVMGIKGRRVHMIEQLSDTVISFQRVSPNAKERIVQITGPNEENVSYATRLIENTIRSNSSPVRELSESESITSSEDSFSDHMRMEKSHKKKADSHSKNIIQPFLYRHKVTVSNCQLTITGDDYNYVTVAKAVLDNFFSKLRQNNNLLENNCDMFSIDELGNDVNFLNTVPESSNLFMTSEKPLLPNQLNEELSYNTLIHSDSVSDAESLEPKLPSFTTYLESVPSMIDSIHTPEYSMLKDFSKLSINFTSEPTKTFTKEYLLKCRKSNLSQQKPKDWDDVIANFPSIVKTNVVEDVIDLTGSTPDSSELVDW